ncbi:MAG TPA: hypothetical protein VM076_19165 [Gemmatimonadaceae bacterium]|nr:hypothetical protein [Gemmatimonadaceae bacterium]
MPNLRPKLRTLLVLIVAACTSQSEPLAPRTPKLSLDASQAVVASASGGGIVGFSAIAGATDGHFTFNASVTGDGRVHGHFHQRRSRGGLIVEFSGDVTCLTIDPVLKRARIGGVITENNSTDPAFLTTNHEVGDDVWFRVQEGGEGRDAVDASTTYGFKPTLVNTSAEYCALPFTGLPAWNPASIFPLVAGNIQIKP